MSTPDDLPPLAFPEPPSPDLPISPASAALDLASLNLDLVQGVRYSLPVMLAEIKSERIEGSYSMEKLDQKEIGKMFQPQRRRRAKSKK